MVRGNKTFLYSFTFI